jgi:phage tail sheath protein FI
MKYGKVKGIERARFEPLMSETDELTMNRQLVTIIRNADDDLCFIGNRNQADDPRGTMKFFTTYRVFRFVERMIANYVRQVVGQRLERKAVDSQVIEPIEAFLNDLRKSNHIAKFELNHDYDEEEYAQGIVSLDITLMPVGPAEEFKIRIGAPKPGTEGASKT